MAKRKKATTNAVAAHPMKRLIFGEGFIDQTLNGSKRFTIRKYRPGSHDFIQGEVIVGEFKDGLNILLEVLKDTHVDTFENLRCPERLLHKEGYFFDEEYFDGLSTFYPDLTWDTPGAVIRFRVLHVNNVPVASLNQET